MKFPQYFTEDCFKKEPPAVIEEKVEALVKAMTAEEKAELCHGGINPEFPGQVGNGGYLKGVPRFGVPEIRMYDGPAGVTSIYETTGLPAEEMLASTWSRSMARAFGQVTGSENKLISGNFQLGAEVDLVRTTHFNRTRDMMGEDPYLAGELAVPLVEGIQENHVCAVLKHFAGYVVSANPANSPNTVIGEQTMHELYLTPFERSIRDGKACGVMTAYNRINGPYAANSAPLLKDVLRDQWNFKGMTMCDWGGNHNFSLKNGMDMEMPVGAYNSTERILRFLDQGKIYMEDLDAAARHVLYSLGAVGYLSLVTLDENGCPLEEADRSEPVRMPDIYENGAALLESNAAVAETVAEKGAVLLKNNNGALPLKPEDVKEKENVVLVGMGAVYPICGYGQERSYGTLKYMTSPASQLAALSENPEGFAVEMGIDLVGKTIPENFLRADTQGVVEGLNRYYGISEADGYRPPMGVGGAGEEFLGTAAHDADEDKKFLETAAQGAAEANEVPGTETQGADADDDENLDFRPMDLFMPGNDAMDMEGYETGSFCCIDKTIDFTCDHRAAGDGRDGDAPHSRNNDGRDGDAPHFRNNDSRDGDAPHFRNNDGSDVDALHSRNNDGSDDNAPNLWKNGVSGRAFEKGSAYTWKGWLVAPEDGEYQLNLQAIGGVAVLKMDVDGTGYKDMGLVKLREGTQWPWGNLVCSPEGMEICATRVRLNKGQSYPILIYGKALLDLKDMQLRLAWVTPSQTAANRKRAIEAAASAEKTVFFIHSGFKTAYNQASGGLSFDEGTDLELEMDQRELLFDLADAAHSHGGQLIVAAYNGSAFAMKPWIHAADALLYMWMPGQGGSRALARLLLGLAVPGGKLPQSFPNTNEDTLITDTPEHQKERWDGVAVPGQPVKITASEGIYTGYRWYDKNGRRPLFEFGYGLSYTTFAYSDLAIRCHGADIIIDFTVENTGNVTGDEIVQVYLGAGQVPEYAMMAQKQLCGFKRLWDVAPGEPRPVSITIPKRCFMYWDVKKETCLHKDGTADKWAVAGGVRKLMVGASSLDIRLTGEVLVEERES